MVEPDWEAALLVHFEGDRANTHVGNKVERVLSRDSSPECDSSPGMHQDMDAHTGWRADLAADGLLTVDGTRDGRRGTVDSPRPIQWRFSSFSV